jgi:hypothetical protein
LTSRDPLSIRDFQDGFLLTTAVNILFDSSALESFINPILFAPETLQPARPSVLAGGRGTTSRASIT